MAAKAAVAVRLRADLVAKLGEKVGEAAMGMRVIGIEPQRGVEVRARRGEVVDLEQQVGEVDVAIRLVRMLPHGLLEHGAGRIAVAGREQHGAEVVERAVVGRCALDQREVVALGLLGAAGFAQQARARVARLGRIRVVRQLRIELREAGRTDGWLGNHRSIALSRLRMRLTDAASSGRHDSTRAHSLARLRGRVGGGSGKRMTPLTCPSLTLPRKRGRGTEAQRGFSQITIQCVPNLSTSVPNFCAKKVLSIGIWTVAPSDRPLKVRSASAGVSTRSVTDEPCGLL